MGKPAPRLGCTGFLASFSMVAIMADKDDVAKWLISEIRANGQQRSYQSVLVGRIREKFGEEWLYMNHNGNYAIDVGVLKLFRAKYKDEYVIWDRSDQSWRVVTPEQLEYIRQQEAQRKEWKADLERRTAEWRASQPRI